MSNHAKTSKNVFLRFFRHIYLSYIPNKRDNLKQILIKILFLFCFAILIVSAWNIADYFLVAGKQDNIVDDSREIWYGADQDENLTEEDKEAIKSETVEKLLEKNNDFKGWIRISGTQVDNPVYQTKDNDYYLNHNQNKQSSIYGALFFDYRNKITETETDKNLIIYGHEMKNGSMFGSLKKLKNLNFYKQNPVIEFSTIYKDSTYKIYSIFILNAEKEDDDGYIYNIYRQNFSGEDDFNSWTDEAYERSIINTNVDVKYGDNIITLVTCSKDFDNARLVVMARETRDGESSTVDTSKAAVNPNPRYPKEWYTKRGIEK